MAFQWGRRTQIVQRLKSLPDSKFRRVKDPWFSQAIPNTQQDKIAKCGQFQHLKWTKMDNMNRDFFTRKRYAGQIVRNLHKENIGVPCRRVRAPDTFPKPSVQFQ